ncbi:magnesium transporter [Mycoplasma testudineum]|uniref:Magnesium transporter MgtE n=1 Tax=Mycoplasma testudineum TaxID=244584 RepID=A0A4R6IFQ5_9MOLU|nr:magnesium transporter [Mycoplasma testudineum]OYD27062.1 magnesium transporter [Mycoplasma testudineum]TDO21183.1 magnesium transporter [Mycoplasma testudineum]
MPKENENYEHERFESHILPTDTIEQDLNPTQLKDELTYYIKHRQFAELRKMVKEWPILNLIESIYKMEDIIQVLFFRFITTEQAAEIFAELDVDVQARLINLFTDDLSSQIINEMRSDEISDLIEELPASMTSRIISKVDDPEKRKKINEILLYEDEQVGSIMSVDIYPLNENWDLRQCLKKLKEAYKKNTEMNHYFFVINEKSKLSGAVSLEDIIFSNRETLLKDVMFPVEAALDTESIDSAQNIYAKQNMSILPVVNENDFFIGILDAEAMLDAARESATEDIYKQAGITVADSSISYMKSSIWAIIKSRVFWLALLLIGSTLSQIVIQIFSDISSNTLSAFVTTTFLTSLVPVLSGAAGNSGSQSSTTITRAASLGEFDDVKLKSIVKREFLIGFWIGLILFVVNLLRLSIYFSIERSLIDRTLITVILMFASSLSLFIIIIFAKMLGTIIPIIAIKFKKDPAVLSAPILATLSDAIAILIFFGLTIAMFLGINQISPLA